MAIVTPQQLFETLTLKTVQEAINSNAPTAEALQALSMYEGDQWLDTDGWIGARPPAGSVQEATMMLAIEAAFVSENVMAEVVNRHKAGILGREPSWRFVPRRTLAKDEEPNESEVARAQELEDALTEWWDKRRPHELMGVALVTALLTGRAPMRVFVPSDLRADDATINAEDLAQALDLIFIDTPNASDAAVLIDANSRHEVGAFQFTKYPESYFLGSTPAGSGQPVVEITYLNDDGTTALRVLDSSGVIEEAIPPLALNRHITQHDLIREPLITDQVRQLQKAINLALTQMLRNVNLAGSLERVLVNLMPPGEYVDAAGKTWVEGKSTGQKTYRAQNMPVGAGVSAFLRGIEVKDKDGNVTGYSNGTINYRDPVPVTTFIETRATLYGSILGQVAQLHALISKDATASGESRKQARAEFESSLTDSSGPINNMGRWLLETVASLAAIFAGTPSKYDDLRCEFRSIVDAGPLSAEERREIVNEFEKGVFSHETTLSRLDSDDVDAEIAQIAEEDAAKQATSIGVLNPAARQAQQDTTVPPVQGNNPPPTPVPTPNPVAA